MQSQTVYYTINECNEKQFYTHHQPSDSEMVVKIETTWNAPLLATTQAWTRYDLTASDVALILSQFDASIIWQMFFVTFPQHDILQYGGASSQFVSLFRFDFAPTKLLLEKCKMMLLITNPNASPSNLCHVRTDHIPSLPRISMSACEFREWQGLVPIRVPSCFWCVKYPQFYQWKDAMYVPIELDTSFHLILFTRIVTSDTQLHNAKPCLANAVVTVCVANQTYKLTNESFFAQLEHVKRKRE